MAAYVLSQADRLHDKTALEVLGDGGKVFSYGALKAAVLGTATGLLERGLKPGNRILLQLGNTADFPIAYLAAIAVGIIPVPLSSQLTKAELDVIADLVQPALILQAEGLPEIDLPRLPADALKAFRSRPPAEFDMADPNRPAYIIFTSGTSGTPRAVVHAHRAIWARRMMWDGWYGLRENDRLMHAGAFNWTYTMGTGLMDPWSIGATALIPSEQTDADELGRLIAQSGATLFAAAPGILRRMLRSDMPAAPALRHGLSAGEKLSTADRQTWQDKMGVQIYEAFGMSECSTFISSAPTRAAPTESAGYVQAGRHVSLVDKNGPVPRGTPGEMAVHRDDPGLMLCYLEAPAETARRYQGDWFLTGDIGIMDADGAIIYQGRADDMMNAGGIRVSPVEVENAMTAHPQISEAAACSVQVRTDVRVIAGFYVSPDVIEEDELRDFLKARLAKYKMPRLFIASNTLPRGANNKLLRARLRDEWETTHGQT